MIVTQVGPCTDFRHFSFILGDNAIMEFQN